MYIALKWLISLAFAMWLGMCSIELAFHKGNRRITNQGVCDVPLNIQLQNVSKTETTGLILKQEMPFIYDNKEHNMEALHLMMFVAGALAVSIFNKKREIYTFAKQKMKTTDFSGTFRIQMEKLKNTAIKISVATLKLTSCIWGKISKLYHDTRNAFSNTDPLKQHRVIVTLINKLKQLGEERKNLGQLLIAAIHENKNIRTRYQLETMAKNRLVQHIENTQKQIKENRSKYISFQQLYLVTHQENIFLKSRIRKLTQEKDDAEKNLMRLVDEIYKSPNNELKAYCSRMIIRTKDNILNSDMNEQIQTFLEKSRNIFGSYSSWSNFESGKTNGKACPRHKNTRFTEVLQEDCLVPTIADAPKLKGLPGECVWTVKDKDGMIEKLYEYDCETDFDNGDTIRRIRQYSVYYDKDCLLDFTNSLPDRDWKPTTSSWSLNNGEYPLTSKRIVTGSEAFQNFLKNNKSILPSRESQISLKSYE